MITKKQKNDISFSVFNKNKFLIKIKITLKNIFINIFHFKNPSILMYSSSMGLSGIYGPKKTNLLSTQLVVKNIIVKLKELKAKNITIFIRGNSKQTNRLNCIETFKNFEFKITGIFDSLLHSHNGCKPRKFRRDKRNIVLY